MSLHKSLKKKTQNVTSQKGKSTHYVDILHIIRSDAPSPSIHKIWARTNKKKNTKQFQDIKK